MGSTWYPQHILILPADLGKPQILLEVPLESPAWGPGRGRWARGSGWGPGPSCLQPLADQAGGPLQQLRLRATQTSRVTLPCPIQVKIPSREDEVDTSSPTGATYSSSLRRSSPRTISFRVRPWRNPASVTAWTWARCWGGLSAERGPQMPAGAGGDEVGSGGQGPRPGCRRGAGGLR